MLFSRMKRAHGCNKALLNKLIKDSGKSMAALSERMNDVSESLLVKLRSGKYPFVVKEERRKSMCDFFRVHESDLFPFIGVNKEKAS